MMVLVSCMLVLRCVGSDGGVVGIPVMMLMLMIVLALVMFVRVLLALVML